MPLTVAENFAKQAVQCDQMGSPFTAGLCRLLPLCLDRKTRFGATILDWTGDPEAAALPLRAVGALHALARSWKEPELKAAYPPAPFDEKHLWARITDVLTRHDNWLADFLESPPQTNEVARSSMLLGAALHLVARTRLPLALYEIGSSAGLNLAFDEYRYDFGAGRTWGSADAPLLIESDWRGSLPPLGVNIRVVSREGCDRNPLDPASEIDRERLMAYIWADQTKRLERIGAALRLAAEEGRKVERADAADWVERTFSAPAQPGVARMLFHTAFWPYLLPETKARIVAALDRAGAAATPQTPLARFSMEGDGIERGGGMTLTIWPGGTVIPLGRSDFHGKWVEWAAI